MRRRAFLKSASGAGVGALAASRLIPAADVEIEVSPDKPGPVINPHIYGHFIEHLGGVIYDGVWVGRNSKIPNVDGIRKQFVEDMKRIGAPNLRWPGGCFADGYHWRDVFEMYRPHMGARLAPMQLRGAELTVPAQEGATKIAALTGSASIREKRLMVTLTNPSVDS